MVGDPSQGQQIVFFIFIKFIIKFIKFCRKIRLSMQRRKMNVGRPRSVFLPNMNDSIVSSSNLNR